MQAKERDDKVPPAGERQRRQRGVSVLPLALFNIYGRIGTPACLCHEVATLFFPKAEPQLIGKI